MCTFQRKKKSFSCTPSQIELTLKEAKQAVEEGALGPQEPKNFSLKILLMATAEDLLLLTIYN